MLHTFIHLCVILIGTDINDIRIQLLGFAIYELQYPDAILR